MQCVHSHTLSVCGLVDWCNPFNKYHATSRHDKVTIQLAKTNNHTELKPPNKKTVRESFYESVK